MTFARIFRRLLVIAAIIALLWAAGLAWFAQNVQAKSFDPANSKSLATDAIVVLTGGSERLKAGLELLQAGRGKKLFISGVHPDVKRAELTAGTTIDAAMRDCCIMLGYMAGDTVGNAAETSVWMHDEKFHSMYLVTSNYHMLRSILEFEILMPDVVIVPYAVSPERVRLNEWWLRPGTANLLVTEYNKFLFTLARYLLHRYGA